MGRIMSRKMLERLRNADSSARPEKDPVMYLVITALALLDEIEVLAQENMILQEADQNVRLSPVPPQKIYRSDGDICFPQKKGRHRTDARISGSLCDWPPL